MYILCVTMCTYYGFTTRMLHADRSGRGGRDVPGEMCSSIYCGRSKAALPSPFLEQVPCPPLA